MRWAAGDCGQHTAQHTATAPAAEVVARAGRVPIVRLVFVWLWTCLPLFSVCPLSINIFVIILFILPRIDPSVSDVCVSCCCVGIARRREAFVI